ncbi:MAG: hypothetical protein HPY73_03245 [Methanomassiliicoccales archaeon]|nr:MAG: hypothetical protein HPY73_03245 [Methanomassiliicoccales archaeon]
MEKRALKIDEKTYQKLVKEVGNPTKSKIRIDVGLAVAMFNMGWSYRQIGKHFGVSGMTVKRRLKESRLV